MAKNDVVVSLTDQIGLTAGVIWRFLDSEGSVTLARLVKGVGVPRDSVMLGLGWLAREGKVQIEEAGRKRTVSLCR